MTIESDLAALARGALAGSARAALVRGVIETLNAQLGGRFKGSSVRPFGSQAAGLGGPASDVDVSLIIAPMQREKESIQALQRRARAARAAAIDAGAAPEECRDLATQLDKLVRARRKDRKSADRRRNLGLMLESAVGRGQQAALKAALHDLAKADTREQTLRAFVFKIAGCLRDHGYQGVTPVNRARVPVRPEKNR